MGDRANILVKENEEDSGVYLYTHWKGSRLPELLWNALSLQERWSDVSYLTKIIFMAMLEDSRGTTGFGISTKITDGDDKIITVDVEQQSINFFDDRFWTFNDYFMETPNVLNQVWESDYANQRTNH